MQGVWLALVVVVGLLVGCGGQELGGPQCDEGQDPTVDECECTGCLVDGECVEGTSVDACGAGGEACSACGADQVCEDRQCLEPPACSPLNCDGCCDGDACLDGGEPEACGSGGEVCASCGAAGSCEDVGNGHQCVQECGPENCDGCCRPDGECVEIPSDSLCGAGGEACSACDAESQCDNGVCVPQDCAATCDGCCDAEGVCHDSTDRDQCGYGGEACHSCGDDEYCSFEGVCTSYDCNETCDGCCIGDTCYPGTENGACGHLGGGCLDCTRFASLDCHPFGTNTNDDELRYCMPEPESTWAIAAVDGQAPETNPDGDAWDAFGGKPDPALMYRDRNGFDHKSSDVSDSFYADWEGEVFTEVLSILDLYSPLNPGALSYALFFLDVDPGFDNRIYRCYQGWDFRYNPTYYNRLFSEEVMTCEDYDSEATFRYRFVSQD